MTNTQLKKYAQKQLLKKFGFAPLLKEIILLEASYGPKYIWFRVGNTEYNISHGVLEIDERS